MPNKVRAHDVLTFSRIIILNDGLVQKIYIIHVSAKRKYIVGAFNRKNTSYLSTIAFHFVTHCYLKIEQNIKSGFLSLFLRRG